MDLIKKIQEELEGYKAPDAVQSFGRIEKLNDGIALCSGVGDVLMSEMVELYPDSASKKPEEVEGTPLVGLTLNIEEYQVGIVVLGAYETLQEGDLVKTTGRVLQVPVGEELLGNVLDPLGQSREGKNIHTTQRNPVERQAPGVIAREGVHEPFHTGIKAIDAMIPIGRGQRELIIGDRGTGKTSIAIDTIINQKSESAAARPICIYVAIGQKESKTAKLVAELAERGAMDYSIVVTAPASAPAALQFLAPFAGASIGEYFMEQGRDALVVYDDLSKQAVAYRQMSLLLRRPPGREAYPGDIFYLHSRLLERAAKLSKEKGGGSLTALPIIETQEGDISAYIPTNVISITDGQIFLLADLFNKGQRPAIDVGNSVSRVGSSAQTKAMKKVAGKIKLELAQFRELEAFMQFSSDLDAETKKRIDAGRRMTEILNQGRGVPLAFEMEAAIIFAATNGYLDTFPPENVSAMEAKLRDYLSRETGSVLAAIKESKEISEQSEKALRE